MFIEIGVGVIAAAAVVLVAFLVPVLIQLRKTTQASTHLLRQMNEDLPLLFKEATQAAQNLNQVATEIRKGAARARVLGEAIGEIGQTINHVHGAVRGGASSLVMNLTSLLTGFRAAYGVFKHKASSSHHQEGGSSDGG
ncbi:MAG: DUF948 domain-containing protein [Nitrospirae bacterium]|nr:MAG: DUF948 domain-containing protein [Nitrospirota bacterium]